MKKNKFIGLLVLSFSLISLDAFATNATMQQIRDLERQNRLSKSLFNKEVTNTFARNFNNGNYKWMPHSIAYATWKAMSENVNVDYYYDLNFVINELYQALLNTGNISSVEYSLNRFG